jgi:hypothetical protein
MNLTHSFFGGLWMAFNIVAVGAASAFPSEPPAGGPLLGLWQTNGVLFKEDQPYRGVGANYFDLFLRVLHEPANRTSLDGLGRLGRAGIPFVRFAVAYDDSDWKVLLDRPEEFFRRLDSVVRAAEQANVGLIPSFFWSFMSFPDLAHEPRDQWGNPDSKTSALMRQIVTDIVERYKYSPALWAWEFGNEPNLEADLPNAAELRRPGGTERDDLTSQVMVVMLREFAKEVRRHDPHRLIIAGHSHPRASAWHNSAEKSWTADGKEQTVEILRRDNPAPLDTIAIHIYADQPVGKETAAWAKDHAEYLQVVRQLAREMKRPVFVGEFGLASGGDAAATRTEFERLLADLDRGRVDLAAFWVFDLESQSRDWSATFENERAYMIKLAAEANRRWNRAALGLAAGSASPELETDPPAVAQCLASLDAWIIAQPKAVRALPGVSFQLDRCEGIVVEAMGRDAADLGEQAAAVVASASGVRLPVLKSRASARTLKLEMLATPRQFGDAAGLGAGLFDQIGDQGYALVIDAQHVVLVARATPGMRHAITTLGQIAADRTVLPGMTICDWPSLKYRGAQQDISRGQVPAPATLKRLASVLAEAKMNELELYIEHEYKYKAFPDISPPEGLAPAEAHELAIDAARHGVEVHPFLQTLGHSYFILNKPQYQHLRVGPCEKAPWIMTFDVRKPEAVRMVSTMIDELCETFPGDLFNVDITEIDIDGLQTNGVSVSQATDLVFGYVLQLDAAVKKHGRRLMIAQGPLDSQGHLAGMGPKLDALPKDIIIGSYYCAGGPYKPAWKKDYPRLRAKGFDFFAQAWIYSHVWLTPWVKPAAEFSDLEVARGLQHGALGSITADWGDAGHFHFVGEEWLPFLYHGACAWTGAQFDRDYFRKAVARVIYGLRSDAALRAIEAASDVNATRITIRDKAGKESEIATSFIWEFVQDPFTHPDLTRIANPGALGRSILDTAVPALAALCSEALQAKRNRDSLEQWAFGVRCYAALGRKLEALGRYNDPAAPRPKVAEELAAVANEYESLQTDFKRLWLAEDRDNDGFQELVRRFGYTIGPCREQAKALRDRPGR